MNKIVTSLIVMATLVSHGADLPDFPFVFARGQADVEIQPDMATVSFQVKAFDKDATNAIAAVQERSRQLVILFSSQNIRKENITAFEIDKDAVREQKDHQNLAVLGYQVTRRFSVILRDLSTYEPFVKALLAMDNVVELNTYFDRTDRKKVESDLIAKASANAREPSGDDGESFLRSTGASPRDFTDGVRQSWGGVRNRRRTLWQGRLLRGNQRGQIAVCTFDDQTTEQRDGDLRTEGEIGEISQAGRGE